MKLRILGVLSHTHTAAVFCSAILTPIAGIGYFCVFLSLQPHSYRYFINTFCCGAKCCVKEQADLAPALSRDSTESSRNSYILNASLISPQSVETGFDDLDENQLMMLVQQRYSAETSIDDDL